MAFVGIAHTNNYSDPFPLEKGHQFFAKMPFFMMIAFLALSA